jgi:hypothetical protein
MLDVLMTCEVEQETFTTAFDNGKSVVIDGKNCVVIARPNPRYNDHFI